MAISNIDKILHEHGYEYRTITEIKPGDYVHRWGDDLEVTKIDVDSDGVATVFYQETDGAEKWARYNVTDELIIKRESQ